MAYDPFARGPHPVGVRTVELRDAARDRALTAEIWYPADAAHAGQDLEGDARDRYQVLPVAPPTSQDAVRDAAPASGRFPVLVFSHGLGGHRRQSTFLCTHVASHGYLVAAPDHAGNTVTDVMQMAMQAMSSGELPDFAGLVRSFIDLRPDDAIFLLDRVLDGGAGDLAGRVDAERVAISGHSFGGWTALAVVQRDPRVRAALPLAPAGGRTFVEPDPFGGSLDFDWGRDVPTLYLVAERDSLLPLDGMHKLYGETRGPKRMAVLRNADHLHFCDEARQNHELLRAMPQMAPGGMNVPEIPAWEDLCAVEHGYHFTRGLGTAHLDAHLKEDARAAQFLEGEVRAALDALGIDVEIH